MKIIHSVCVVPASIWRGNKILWRKFTGPMAIFVILVSLNVILTLLCGFERDAKRPIFWAMLVPIYIVHAVTYWNEWTDEADIQRGMTAGVYMLSWFFFGLYQSEFA